MSGCERQTKKRKCRQDAPLLLGRLAERRVQNKQNILEGFAATCGEIRRLAGDAIDCSNDQILEVCRTSWKNREAEMFLVSTLGLEGIEALQVADQMFPKLLGRTRLEMTLAVLNEVLKKQYSVLQCSIFLEILPYCMWPL